MNKKRIAVLSIAVLLFLAALPTWAVEDEITYGVLGSGYVYKISVTKDVIEAAGKVPCDSTTDPYQCDRWRYNQALNCPTSIALGGQGVKPIDAIGAATEGKSGGAGQGAGMAPEDRSPPGASPVRVNELVTVATISKAGSVLGSSGMASDTFIEQSGRYNPEAHVESDAFVSTKNFYEERCDPVNTSSYVHVFTRSEIQPEIFTMSECFSDQCSQSGIGARGFSAPRPSAQEARTMAHLSGAGGKIQGRVKSFISKMGGASGANSLTAESVLTYISFESDGSPKGLKWTALTTASGVKINGQEVALEPGQTFGVDIPGAPPELRERGAPGPQSFFVGLSAPYVISKKDGTQLKIYAPGMFYGTETQTTYIGGAQLDAGLGRAPAFDFLATDFPSSFGTISFLRPGPPPFGSAFEPTPDSSSGQAIDGIERGPILSVREMATGPAPMIILMAAAGFALALLMLGWIQRFEWGRHLFGFQPLRSVNWVYRAFVRT